MAAKEDELGVIHDKLCRVLDKALDGQVLPAELDEEGNVVNPESWIPPSAAILTVVAKVLKDNNITCAPSKDNAIGELQRKQEERAAAREARRSKVATPRMTPDAGDFLEGLPKHH